MIWIAPPEKDTATVDYKAFGRIYPCFRNWDDKPAIFGLPPRGNAWRARQRFSGRRWLQTFAVPALISKDLRRRMRASCERRAG